MVTSSNTLTQSSPVAVGDLIASGLGLSSDATGTISSSFSTQIFANTTTVSHATASNNTSASLVTAYTGDCWNQWSIYWYEPMSSCRHLS